jgi:hypothetical protein
MSLSVGNAAPDFTAATTEGAINFHEWLAQYHPDPELPLESSLESKVL